ncbi:ATP-dependent Clp protease adaptor ClpS [Maribellus luteus]|uniref:ATP-dependent Clp protease adaptor ClpS n=1 Tax=Maribellus luteus TaxID=2305463 RepID=A0A399SWP6_9BACT|nr:ATP-dependent Clp protease adaptor ClpS [Maribellus luteus]RIJ46437.1 ATP-dependent Clp protease adaptor ClpS [Maribellus luteus]
MTLKEPKNIPVDKSNEDTLEENSLILHNDDVHTFDYVIDALIDICEHEIEQATQCTYLVHYKGKCDVKKGSFSELKPMKDALIGRELNATID